MADYSVGVDLGQLQDYTAIAIVGLDEAYLDARRKEIRSRYSHKPGSPHRQRELAGVPPPDDPIYEVRHLERLPLRTPYTTVARRVRGLMETATARTRCRADRGRHRRGPSPTSSGPKA